jgi:hypothetical protein
MTSEQIQHLRNLETELVNLLDNVRVNYLRALSYPPGDWYGEIERNAFFENNTRFAPISGHRLRELAKSVLEQKGD